MASSLKAKFQKYHWPLIDFMSPLPTITVIVPVFNRSDELSRALSALAVQTDPDFEVVVCDDGSSEDISAVTQKFDAMLRLRLIRIENSGGPARPRNMAALEATTEWLSFLDSDDWWFPERIACVKAALDGRCDLLYHQLRVEREDTHKAAGAHPHGAVLGSRMRSAHPLTHMIRFGNPLPTSATIVRRSLMLKLGGFNESRDLASVEDFDAWLRLCSAGARVKFLPRILGAYWVGNDQISTFNARQYDRQQKLFVRQMQLLPKIYLALAESNFYYLLGSYALALGLPGSKEHFKHVSFYIEPQRWIKSRIKLLLAFFKARSYL